MKIDLSNYISCIPKAKAIIESNPEQELNELTNKISNATHGVPLIVVNRIVACIKGESEETLKQKDTLCKFYNYTEIVGEKELKEKLENF